MSQHNAAEGASQGICAPVRDQVATYLNLLYGAEPEPSLIEVRFRGNPRWGQRFESVRPKPGFADWLLHLGETTDVYVGVAPRTEPRGRRDAVARIHAVWADCDTPESVAALKDFRPRPSFIVSSGNGLHPYWGLWPPAGADAIEQANRRIAHRLGADAKATDAARVLRPPGTFNHKGDTPKLVQITHLEPEAVYALSEVAGRLPDPPLTAAPIRTVRTERAEDDDVVAALRTIEPAEYVQVLTGRAVGRDGKVCCPFHDDRTPSLHCYGPSEGWTCFGSCQPQPGRQNLGGDVFTFGGLLWKLDPHKDFLQLRDRLADQLLGAAR